MKLSKPELHTLDKPAWHTLGKHSLRLATPNSERYLVWKARYDSVPSW